MIFEKAHNNMTNPFVLLTQHEYFILACACYQAVAQYNPQRSLNKKGKMYAQAKLIRLQKVLLVQNLACN